MLFEQVRLRRAALHYRHTVPRQMSTLRRAA
jgi:hypothetical protein